MASMTEDIESDGPSVELWNTLAKLDEKALLAAMKRVPELLAANKLLVYSTHDRTRLAVAKDVDEKDARNIRQALNLAAIFISAHEADMEEQFEKEIPAEHREHILSLVETLKTNDSFPVLYYRLSRIKGFVVPPLYARKLNHRLKDNEPGADFFEVILRHMDSNGEVSRITLEMDSYEIHALIEELTDLLNS